MTAEELMCAEDPSAASLITLSASLLLFEREAEAPLLTEFSRFTAVSGAAAPLGLQTAAPAETRPAGRSKPVQSRPLLAPQCHQMSQKAGHAPSLAKELCGLCWFLLQRGRQTDGG